MKKILGVLLIIIFAGVIIFALRFIVGGNKDSWLCQNGQWVKHGNPSAPMPIGGCGNSNTEPSPSPTSGQSPAANFSESGTILDWDSRLEKETGQWYLLYEKPGQPALRVNLIFNKNSKCQLGGFGGFHPSGLINVPSCALPPSNGDKVLNLEGYKTGDSVIVYNVTIDAIKSAANNPLLANPASVYCGVQGGTLIITTNKDGSQSGQCVFGDGRRCDEWKFYRTKICSEK